ncbi:MAG: MraY family glycosyltransferase, partial [Campylobacterota bacterium]|nr:MraY family glycosyltransferase [Campylobacterota bacterium]
MFILKLSLTLFLSYFFIKLIIKFAKNMYLHYSHIEHNTNKERYIPVGGGIGFFLAFLSYFILFEIDILIENWYIFFSIFLIFIIGIIDDIKDIKPYVKLIVISLSVLFLFIYDIYISNLGNWFGYQLDLPIFIAIIFNIFAITGFTNALNLIDGIDGLAASISIVILILFTIIGFEYNNTLIFTISLITIVSLISFLFLNWYPAKIFMGDSGSLSLGFIISILAVLSLEYIHPVVILYLTAIPILDTLIVMTRRIRRGVSPFSPDKTHIHHILVKFFDGRVKKTLFFLVILQIIFSSIGYMLIDIINRNHNSFAPFIAIVGFILMFIVFYMIFT